MSKKRINIYTVVVYLSCFCICMSLNITGPMLNDLMIHYEIPLSNGGMMSLFQYLGGMAAIIIGSVLVNRSNKAIAFVIPLLFLGFSMFFIGMVPSYVVFMIMYLCMGMGLAMGDVFPNALIPDLQRENKDKALTLLHCVTGSGAVIMALSSGFLLDSGIKWNSVYTYVGSALLVLSVLNIVVYALTKRDVKPRVVSVPSTKEKGVLKMFLKDKRVWVSILVLILYGSYNGTVITWGPQFCIEVFGVSSTAASISIVAFWGGMVIVRLLLSLTKLGNIKTKPATIFGGIACGIVLIIGILSKNYYVTVIAIGLSGAATAPLLPQNISLATNYHKEHSGLASSAIFLGMYIAFAFMPLLAGILAAKSGMNAILLLAAICSILSGFAATLLKE